MGAKRDVRGLFAYRIFSIIKYGGHALFHTFKKSLFASLVAKDWEFFS
jgi:hypothetical protein